MRIADQSVGNGRHGRNPGNEVSQIMNWKRKLSIVAVPAALALVGGVAAVHAAPSSPVRAAAAVGAATVGAKSAALKTSAPTTTLRASAATSETEAEQAESNEPSVPGGGHADPTGDVNHDFQGIE